MSTDPRQGGELPPLILNIVPSKRRALRVGDWTFSYCMQALGCAHIRQVAGNQALSGVIRTLKRDHKDIVRRLMKDLATSQENLSRAELAACDLEQSKTDLSARNTELLVRHSTPNLLAY